MFWQMDFHGVTLGNTSFTPSVNVVMADSGTSLNMIPDDDFYAITDMFLKGKKCHTMLNTLMNCECTKEEHEQVPDINFKIGENDFVIPRDMWYERGGNQCVVKFMHSPGKEYWILGLNFFNNYYTVFDYEQQAIGFAESINFRGPQSKSFITWALSGTSLLNLSAKLP